ncbi:MAG: hypothetical protein ACJ8GN_25175 [Longimicrobiaceae bacterium]
MLGALAVSACQDFPTTAVPERRPVRSPALPPPELPAGPEYVCTTSELRTGGEHPYHYTRVILHFPAAELGDGETRELRLNVQEQGKVPVIAASCRIPNSRAAAERLYNTFVRVLAQRARLEPLRYTLPRNEAPRFATTRRRTGGVPLQPRMNTDPCPEGGCTLAPLVVIGTPVNEGSATGWSGDEEWGWGSQGDTYSSGGGEYWDPATYDGPVLGFIICVAGFIGAGFSIYDVYDTFKQLTESKREMESTKRMYEMYIQQPEQDPATRLLLEYMWRQAEMVYLADVHSLATKIYVSEASVIVAAVACGGALVSPTP